MKLRERAGGRLVLALVVVLGASGCEALLGGAGAAAVVAYAAGAGKKAYAEPLGKTLTAVLGAFADMSLPILHKDMIATSAKVKSVAADGRDIVVILTRESDRITMVSVRVGALGDETLTREIFDKIDDRLKLM